MPFGLETIIDGPAPSWRQYWCLSAAGRLPCPCHPAELPPPAAAARLTKLRTLNVVWPVSQLRFGVGTPTLTASSAEQTHPGNQT